MKRIILAAILAFAAVAASAQTLAGADIFRVETGKTVIPFTTHEGSGFGSGLRDLKAAVQGATVTNGLSLRGTAARSSDAQIEKFVTGGK